MEALECLCWAGAEVIVLGLAASMIVMFAFGATIGIGGSIGEDPPGTPDHDGARVSLLFLCWTLSGLAAGGIAQLGKYWFS